jgi:serine/threonine-protein kinase
MSPEGESENGIPKDIEGRVVGGQYRIGRMLGQGGMGAVFEATNTTSSARCAVKLLLSELARKPGVVQRFFREAQACSLIDSDHIVQIEDAGVDADRGWPYMVMELLEGEDLEHALRRTGAMHPEAAAKIALQAAAGLAHAHAAGIVHRDIKPANLFLMRRPTGEILVKLLDFGIAKVKHDNTALSLTRTGHMLGTPLYMSPEQATGATNTDARSDVWSLGIVLFEALTGTLPYADRSSFALVIASILTERLPLVQDRAPWIPPELAEITHRAMSRSLAARFMNAGELRDALARVVPGDPRLLPEEVVTVSPEARAVNALRVRIETDTLIAPPSPSGERVVERARRPRTSLVIAAAR